MVVFGVAGGKAIMPFYKDLIRDFLKEGLGKAALKTKSNFIAYIRSWMKEFAKNAKDSRWIL